MAESGLYDAVFFGHTHELSDARIRDTIVVNPGEISAQKTGKATYAVYDTEVHRVEIRQLKGSISIKSDLVTDYFKTNSDALSFRSEKTMMKEQSIQGLKNIPFFGWI